MSEINSTPIDSEDASSEDARHSGQSRALQVKRVPESIWRRARSNAAQSGMTFRDYIIHVLGSCTPLEAKACIAINRPEQRAARDQFGSDEHGERDFGPLLG